MRIPNSYVLEQLEARAEDRGICALAAYNRGDRVNGNALTQEATLWRQRTERYRQTGSWRFAMTD